MYSVVVSCSNTMLAGWPGWLHQRKASATGDITGSSLAQKVAHQTAPRFQTVDQQLSDQVQRVQSKSIKRSHAMTITSAKREIIENTFCFRWLRIFYFGVLDLSVFRYFPAFVSGLKNEMQTIKIKQRQKFLLAKISFLLTEIKSLRTRFRNLDAGDPNRTPFLCKF